MNECSKTEYFVLTIDPCSGISSLSFGEGQGVRFFPNPSSGIINISAGFDAITDFTINLINMQGVVIHTESKYGYSGMYQAVWDVIQYAKGVYTLQLLTNEGSSTSKIILE